MGCKPAVLSDLGVATPVAVVERVMGPSSSGRCYQITATGHHPVHLISTDVAMGTLPKRWPWGCGHGDITHVVALGVAVRT